MASVVPFGKYLLLGRIAQGGMAEVFLAKTFGAEGFERFVAIKRLLPSVMHNKEFVNMFVDEAKLTSQLSHANITQIYELGRIDNQLFIAMEFVHGKELRALSVRARKQGKRFDPRVAAHLVSKAAEGLDYAHHKKDPSGRSVGLIHRDISPQNLLLSYDGEVKIIDFGIAKAKDRISQTQVGVLKGKIGYMSPEQVGGMQIDSRSDLFSLGCVLYEMVTAERAFKAENEFATFEKVREAAFTPTTQYGITLDPQLDRIMRKALARDRDQRYLRGAELHADLQRFLLASGDPFSNEAIADYIRRLFEKEYAAEMQKLAEYRAFRPPEEIKALIEDRQARVEAEKKLEDHTTMISVPPREERADTVTDRVMSLKSSDVIAIDVDLAETAIVASDIAAMLKSGAPSADDHTSDDRATDVVSPALVAAVRSSSRLTEQQAMEKEIREAFSGIQQPMPLTPKPMVSQPSTPRKRSPSEPSLAKMGINAASVNEPRWSDSLQQVPSGMLETIDQIEEDVPGFTKGEMVLIAAAALLAVIFVIGVWFFTSR